MKLREGTSLVLFSGGQDSTTCLAWALNRYEHVETVGFYYGQRHAIELECRARILARIRANFPQWGEKIHGDHIVSLSTLAEISETALTHDVRIAFHDSGLPTTFVPGRNLVMFTFAAAIAYRRGIRALVGGMCEMDYAGYPDCRDDALKALQVALNLGLESRFSVETPLMWLDKAQTWALAEQLGGKQFVELIIEETHTCYLGVRSARYEWGYGCGTCPACNLRRIGYTRYRESATIPRPPTLPA